MWFLLLVITKPSEIVGWDCLFKWDLIVFHDDDNDDGDDNADLDDKALLSTQANIYERIKM